MSIIVKLWTQGRGETKIKQPVEHDITDFHWLVRYVYSFVFFFPFYGVEEITSKVKWQNSRVFSTTNDGRVCEKWQKRMKKNPNEKMNENNNSL